MARGVSHVRGYRGWDELAACKTLAVGSIIAADSLDDVPPMIQAQIYRELWRRDSRT